MDTTSAKCSSVHITGSYSWFVGDSG